jgi:hypothetical protein
MQIRFFVLIVLAFSFSIHAQEWKKFHLVNGCRVYTMSGFMQRAFPGSICIFLDNGNLVSASDNAIRMINPKNEIVWEQKGHFHHQVNLSSDKSKILALSSEINNGLREDTFYILDFNGKIVSFQKASELYKFAGLKPLNWGMQPLTLNGVSTSQEFSHFNSIYDVPRLTGKNLPAWLKEGNIVVNSTHSGIFVLSPDMTLLLHHILLPGSTYHRVHDVQVKSNGNFLLFNNLVAIGPPTPYFLTGPRPTNHHSAIQEIHPTSLKVVQEFSANPKTLFYSWICGSVQELDSDTWLITHFLSGTYIYSKSKKDFVASIPGTHADNQRFSPVQQVKAQDLSKFMSYWP